MACLLAIWMEPVDFNCCKLVIIMFFLFLFFFYYPDVFFHAGMNCSHISKSLYNNSLSVYGGCLLAFSFFSFLSLFIFLIQFYPCFCISVSLSLSLPLFSVSLFFPLSISLYLSLTLFAPILISAPSIVECSSNPCTQTKWDPVCVCHPCMQLWLCKYDLLCIANTCYHKNVRICECASVHVCVLGGGGCVLHHTS